MKAKLPGDPALWGSGKSAEVCSFFPSYWLARCPPCLIKVEIKSQVDGSYHFSPTNLLVGKPFFLPPRLLCGSQTAIFLCHLIIHYTNHTESCWRLSPSINRVWKYPNYLAGTTTSSIIWRENKLPFTRWGCSEGGSAMLSRFYPPRELQPPGTGRESLFPSPRGHFK